MKFTPASSNLFIQMHRTICHGYFQADAKISYAVSHPIATEGAVKGKKASSFLLVVTTVAILAGEVSNEATSSLEEGFATFFLLVHATNACNMVEGAEKGKRPSLLFIMMLRVECRVEECEILKF